MDIPVGIAIALGSGLSVYWMGRLTDRDRANRADRELREWIEVKYVSKEVLDSELKSIHNRLRDLDIRITRMHNENSGKLDHLLSIVSQLTGLGTQPFKHRRPEPDTVEEY